MRKCEAVSPCITQERRKKIALCSIILAVCGKKKKKNKSERWLSLPCCRRHCAAVPPLSLSVGVKLDMVTVLVRRALLTLDGFPHQPQKDRQADG
ncbi:hypothetical protein E2C01_024039 [Portunus trituberculatus]|uniref:Uncharacterized protein n=1 Tax=Portunus trituberculatus TaxID=210409 RepID=A0A5B7E9D8_PORTR|nr:hypothetical protein [Portunus trituberculatus]